MDANFNFIDRLKVWGLGDTATAAQQLAGAGLGEATSIQAALESGNFRGEALKKVVGLAPQIAKQFPHLAAAVGYKLS